MLRQGKAVLKLLRMSPTHLTSLFITPINIFANISWTCLQIFRGRSLQTSWGHPNSFLVTSLYGPIGTTNERALTIFWRCLQQTSRKHLHIVPWERLYLVLLWTNVSVLKWPPQHSRQMRRKEQIWNTYSKLNCKKYVYLYQIILSA